MCGGSQWQVKNPGHADRCAQAVVEQIRLTEMVQAIDRLRLNARAGRGAAAARQSSPPVVSP
jgi:hypothetical protein